MKGKVVRVQQGRTLANKFTLDSHVSNIDTSTARAVEHYRSR